MKRCGQCHRHLSLTEFGANRARKDGQNIYCKSCNRAKRERARHNATIRKMRSLPETPRKPEVKAPVLHSPESKVRFAIKSGYRTREEIKDAITREANKGVMTELSMDEICDVLAEFYDQGVIRPVGGAFVMRAIA
jgi:hypothetical protein